MKTYVTAMHEHGPMINGGDQCYARAGNEGMCPGVKHAEWLNALGEDNEAYSAAYTNFEVRMQYVKNAGFHVVAVEPNLSALKTRSVALRKELARIEALIKCIKEEKAEHVSKDLEGKFPDWGPDSDY
jgi:hypothetical protein